MKVNIKVAHLLLERVTEAAGVALNHAGLEVLSERINEKVDGPIFNQKYLYYNLLKKIEKYKDQPEAHIGLNANYLHGLAQYLEFNDFFHFEKSLNSPTKNEDDRSLKAWYTDKKFGALNIWRNPDLGRLVVEEQQIHFYGKQHLTIEKVEATNTVSMPGDGGKYWVKVTCQVNGNAQDAYFANAKNPMINLRLGSIQPIYDFFQKGL